jgi:hypothetical protein
MTISPVAKKLGIRAGMSVLVLGAPSGYLKSLTPLPEGVVVSEEGGGTSTRSVLRGSQGANPEIGFETAEVRCAGWIGLDHLPEEDIRCRERPQPRRIVGSHGWYGVASRSAGSYRRGLVCAALPSSGGRQETLTPACERKDQMWNQQPKAPRRSSGCTCPSEIPSHPRWRRG